MFREHFKPFLQIKIAFSNATLFMTRTDHISNGQINVMCCFKPDLQLDIHLDGAPLNAPLEGGLRVLEQEADLALGGVHPLCRLQ